MMMNRKMRKKEHVKKTQRHYNMLASKRRNDIRKLVRGLKGELMSWNFTCCLCGHHHIKLRYILSAFEDKGWGKVNLETEYINI